MTKQYGYQYFQNIKKAQVLKSVSIFNSALLVFQLFVGGVFFTLAPLDNVEAVILQNNCTAAVDTVMVMDRSGSMGDGGSASRCDWEYIGDVGGGFQWIATTTYSVDKDWCDAKSQPPTRLSIFKPATLNKLEFAKQAASSYLAHMGANDQSALVSFASEASLDKNLSNSHGATQAAINALVAVGSTNIGQAISLANTELGSGNPKAAKAMILLTDGKANKPLGTGDGEDPRDVAYAEDMAAVAAGMGYKIFTIGLGSDVNTTMLQNIATVTGAEYFFAPSGSDLASIYATISQRVCEYGSISGCKYSDLNGDGSIAGDAIIPGWTIYLNDLNARTSLSRDTDANGCYSFSGLELGDYVISEATSTSYIQTYPVLEKTYTISIDPDNTAKKDITNIDFGNYPIVCGNGIVDTGEDCDDGNTTDNDGCSAACQTEGVFSKISGFKYNDKNKNSINDDGGAVLDGIEIQLIGCPYPPMAADTSIFLSKSVIGTDPGSCAVISTTTTDSTGYYQFTNLTAGDYGVGEATSSPWQQTYPLNNQIYYFNLNTGKATTSIDFLNYLPTCGNNIVDSGETCDDGNVVEKDGCDSTCQIEKDNKFYSVTGYKYQDFDNNVASTSDWVGIGDWTIEIFDISASSTAQATTSVNGYFEFNNLLNGTYTIIEIMKSGWTQLLAPTNNIIIAGTSSTGNIFVNYYGVCGNNIIDTGETCDDGNLVNGDGCSASCESEGGNGAYCGDGVKNQTSEECDGSDGLTSGYSCLSTCLLHKENNNGGGGSGGGISFFPAPQNPATTESQTNEVGEVTVLGETGAPELIVTKSVNKSFANPGNEVEYTIKAVNNGQLSAFNTILKDKLPAGLSYMDDGKSEREWILGDLKTGEVKEFKYRVKIAKDAEAKKYVNTATLKADNHNEISASATTEVRKIEVLAETGFANSEFAVMLILIAFFTFSAFWLRQEQADLV